MLDMRFQCDLKGAETENTSETKVNKQTGVLYYLIRVVLSAVVNIDLAKQFLD